MQDISWYSITEDLIQSLTLTVSDSRNFIGEYVTSYALEQALRSLCAYLSYYHLWRVLPSRFEISVRFFVIFPSLSNFTFLI